jgi:tetratricopeptide (TPR) repeat protein
MRLFSIAILTVCSLAGLRADPPDTKHEIAIAKLRQGQDALRQEHWEEAEGYFKDAIGYDPLLEMAHYGLGQSLMAQHRYDDAVRAYKQCRETYLQNSRAALTDDVKAQQRIEDQIRSLKEYKSSVTPGVATLSSATQNMLDNQIAQLQAMLHRGTAGAPQVAPFISTALGSAYFRQGNLPLAEAEWKNALAVDPKIGEVHNNLAVVCLMSGRPAEAAEHVRQAEKAGIRVNPQLKQDIADRLK